MHHWIVCGRFLGHQMFRFSNVGLVFGKQQQQNTCNNINNSSSSNIVLDAFNQRLDHIGPFTHCVHIYFHIAVSSFWSAPKKKLYTQTHALTNMNISKTMLAYLFVCLFVRSIILLFYAYFPFHSFHSFIHSFTLDLKQLRPFNVHFYVHWNSWNLYSISILSNSIRLVVISSMV